MKHGDDRSEAGTERRLDRRRFLRAIGATTGAGAIGAAAGTSIGEASGSDVGDDDRAGLGTTIHDGCEWDRTDDSKLPFETEGYGGWGGHEFHDTDPGVDRYPIVFAHGNSADACDFLEHATYLLDRGFAGDELWAITFGTEVSTHDEMRAQLDEFVTNVLDDTGADRVQVVGHSLGVTGLRYWLDGLDEHPERYDRVETVVGLAGANHGTWTCGPGCLPGFGTARVCGFISHACADTPGEPLYELNAPDETPHGTHEGGWIDYYTIRGYADGFFAFRPESPTLEGATNVGLNADHGDVRTAQATKQLLAEWLDAPV